MSFKALLQTVGSALALLTLGSLVAVALWVWFLAPAPEMPPAEETKPAFKLDGVKGRVVALAFSPDSTRLAFSGGMTNEVSVLDLKTQKASVAFKAHMTPPCGLRYTKDGSCLVVGDTGDQFRDARTGEPVKPSTQGLSHDVRVDLSPDGKLAALWGLVNTGAPRPPDPRYPDKPRGAMQVSLGVIQVVDVQTGERVFGLRLPGEFGGIYGFSLSPDGERIAVDSLGGVRVWALHSGEECFHIPRIGVPDQVLFTPDGKWLAVTKNELRNTGNVPTTIHVHDAQTGEERFRLDGHPGLVDVLACTADGRFLVSAGGEGAVKVWDLRQRRMVVSLVGNSGSVRSVALSPDNRYLATGHGNDPDGRVLLWDVSRHLAPSSLSSFSLWGN